MRAMEEHPEGTDRQYWEGSALEQLRDWLVGRSVPGRQAAEIVDRVGDFYADAFGLLDFPPAIGIDALVDETRGLGLQLIWPEAVPLSQRAGYEERLRETFEQDLGGPLMPTVPCQLTFTDALPTDEKAYPCYLGPSVRGYQAFAARFWEVKQALVRSPALAQELARAVDRFWDSPKRKCRVAAQEIARLIAELRSS